MSSHTEFANQAPGAEGYRKDHPAAAHCRILDREKGEIDLMGRKKIAICGFASSSRHHIPFDDPEWIIVLLNQLYRHCPRADVLFEIHEYWDEANVPDTDHAGWIRDCGIPVVMSQPYLDSPTTVRYPIERLIAKHGLDYFTSTVAFELAWAIDYIDQQVHRQLTDEGGGSIARARELYAEYTIGIFGIDMIVGTEYFCVVPDTKVLTADLQWVAAGMLSPSDRLVGFDEHRRPGTGGRRYRTATVTGANRIKRECSRVVLRDGTTLVVSSDHPWLTKAEHDYRWRKTDQLITKHHRRDRPSKLVKLVTPWPQPVHSWDAGYLAAAFDGEGHLGGPNDRVGRYGNISYAQRDNAMAETVVRALNTYGFQYHKRRGRGPSTRPCHTWRLAGGRPEILRFLGQMRPQRLLAAFDPEQLGRLHMQEAVEVVSVEPVGEREVVALGTSTGTFIAEGFASHNTQKACVEFWMGVAEGRGINFKVPPECALLKQQYRYAYEREPSIGLLKLSELQTRKTELENIKGKIAERMHALNGALQTLHAVKQSLNGDSPAALDAKIAEIQPQLEKTVAELQTYDGAYQECGHVLSVLELRSRGGVIPLQQFSAPG